MTFASNSFRLIRSILFIAAFATGAARAEPEPAQTEPLPRLEPLSVTAASMRKARDEVLSSLYDQLKKSG